MVRPGKRGAGKGGALFAGATYSDAVTEFQPVFDFAAHESVAEREERGRTARQRVPRSAQGDWSPSSDRRDPVTLLQEQEASRVPALLPLRHERMGVSAFTFYRGSAVIMAADLGSQPDSGLRVQLCGDAHLSNFGLFAAPDRTPVFDLNDFDETNPGPFEWDVKRLATSFILAARDNGLPAVLGRKAARVAGSQYRESMAVYAQRPEIDIWYERISIADFQRWAKENNNAIDAKTAARAGKKALSRTMWTAVEKLTEVVDGHRRFLDSPPLLARVPGDSRARHVLMEAMLAYRDSLPDDRRALLERYQVIDVGHKVVGVGSVGLLAWVLLLEGRDPNDILVLQAKQAQASVLEPYTAPSVYPNSGQRVVEGQRFIQAASDSFLGWSTGKLGREYYVRQLRDMKWSPDPSKLDGAHIIDYAGLCGHVLARAHARSGDAIAISSYLGRSDAFDRAIEEFSREYADTVEDDYVAFREAVADGRLGAHGGSSDFEMHLKDLRSAAPHLQVKST